ncbi:MAG TPA: tyrosine--tRNA ligase [Bacteroidia bacterium]|nr:tyrosine--tRNA ligase [Bacteroidia bacterium]MBP7713689.1 tyrosine--tRNA ligase [Bacteroidia bacterium]MBP8667494.1 tyrosine--tRNA ligase [Bacteroidia bacterium]HOZ82232.1 tyrosine--tRNA ligase [Bacteroidia bacterium]HOZ91005.1 tyrosine--tRNA ligase [Bacteroidia bacterium]
MGFIDELRWRGMLQDIMPGTEELLNKETVTGYIGFDPTSDSLGVGNLVQVTTLMHFQRAGHKPIALVGGATGMVGDPSGKSAERNMLNEETLQHNLNCQKKQLEKFLDFDCGKNSAEIVNNYDWFRDVKFLDFIRDVGKHITVNYMLAKDSVKNRLENGMTFMEMAYQLVQGYDFYHLYYAKNCKLQMGGSDQWGNIVTGTELLRRKGRVEDAFALTTPLIKKADGTKFGKTESGNLWLDRNKTSPYAFYQFWLNASDEDAKNYIRIFSLKNQQEIEAIESEHLNAPHLRLLQKTLANEITTRVHSQQDCDRAIEISEVFFNGTDKELAQLTESDLQDVFNGLGKNAFEVELQKIQAGIQALDLFAAETTIFTSKGEARKMITANGVSLNKLKFSDPSQIINKEQLIANKFLLIQKGKKNFFLIKAV